MIKLIFALALCLSLAACGGGGSAIPSAVAATTSTPDMNFNGLSIRRGATVSDGYSGGLNVLRDTTGLAGGTPGAVNTATLTRTVAGQGGTAFERANLAILDNYAERGENVAMYGQGIKWGLGATWGGVSQVVDHTINQGAAVVHEFDLAVRGADTGNRIGLDIVLGRVKEFPDDPLPVGSVGVRVGAADQATWSNGVQLLGDYKTGIDLRGNYQGSVIKYTSPSGEVLFEIKPNGDIYKKGVKVKVL
jgi:hypothetical protein